MALLSQFIRFALVGAVSTAIHYLLLYVLHGKFGWDGILSTTLGLTVSAAFNFSANYRFTFRSRLPIVESLLRFLGVTTIGLLLNAAIYWLLVTRLGWYYLAGQATATAAVLIWNFSLARAFAYAPHSISR